MHPASFVRRTGDLGDLLLDDAVLVDQQQDDQRDAADQRDVLADPAVDLVRAARSEKAPGARVAPITGPNR